MNCNTTHYRANSSSVPGDPTAGAVAVDGELIVAATTGNIVHIYRDPIDPVEEPGSPVVLPVLPAGIASVAIDGGVVVVGVPLSDACGVNTGEAFVLTDEGGEWHIASTIGAFGPEPGGAFGTAVALAGEILVVGAPGSAATSRGRVALFLDEPLHASRFGPHALLAPTPAPQSLHLGAAVATDGNAIVVGAPLTLPTGEGGGAGQLLTYVVPQ